MSRAVLIATVALMFGSTVADAQDRMQRPDRPGQPGKPGGPGNAGPGNGGPGRPGGLPPGAGNKLPPGMNRPGGPGNGGPAIQPPRPGNGGPAIQPPRPGRPEVQPPRPGRPNVRPPRPPVVVRPPHGGGNWNRPPIHRPGWSYPHGYSYRRWSIGLLLPSLFLADRYYYNDYAALGLYAPPRGYRWVRYGPDLLLVRKKNGQIKEVYYNVFG